MHGTEEVASRVIFGWDPLWVASILLIFSYAIIISEKVNRAIISLLGAGLMIILGIINQQTAISGIDFNTLGLLTGMMVIVAITNAAVFFSLSPCGLRKRSMPGPSVPGRAGSGAAPP